MLNYSKKLISKGIGFAMKALPVIVPMLLILNANSTASSLNGQPEPPASIKQYRKF